MIENDASCSWIDPHKDRYRCAVCKISLGICIFTCVSIEGVIPRRCVGIYRRSSTESKYRCHIVSTDSCVGVKSEVSLNNIAIGSRCLRHIRVRHNQRAGYYLKYSYYQHAHQRSRNANAVVTRKNHGEAILGAGSSY